jgi:hypothetical protein
MLIPGYRVYVAGIFELPVQEWRDKYIFGFNWRLNFKSMNVTFPDQPQQNFEVSNLENYFGIEGIKTDTTRLYDFLDRVSLLTVDQYLDKTPEQGDQSPVVNISVFTIGNREYKLALFPGEESGHFRGVINGVSRAHFSASKINSLLKGKDYYILKEEQ